MHTLFLSCLLTLTHTGVYPNLPELSDGSYSHSYVPKNDDVEGRKCLRDLSVNPAHGIAGKLTRKVLQKIDSHQPKSYVFSPIAVTLNLYILNNGLTGENYRKVQKTLGYDSQRCISKFSIQTLVDDLAGYSELGLKLDNRLFASSKMRLGSKFTNVVTTTFRSAIQGIDFENPVEASNIISAWCEEITDNHEDIVTKRLRVNADTSVAIASVVYFKRKWLVPFAEKKTKPHTFTDKLGVTHQVPTMNKIMRVRFADIQDMKLSIFELPFEKSSGSQNSAKTNVTGMSMFVISPTDLANPASLNSLLENRTILKSLFEAEFSQIRIRLPKFRLQSDINIKVPLETIAPGGIFPEESEFTAITESSYLNYHQWEQKTLMSVDENGVEIATSETIGHESSTDNDPFTDRPFYILICTYPHADIIFAARASA